MTGIASIATRFPFSIIFGSNIWLVWSWQCFVPLHCFNKCFM